MFKAPFNGEILNPRGERIFLTCEAFNRLRRAAVKDENGKLIKAVVWDKKQECYRLTDLAACLLDLWDWMPEFRHKPLKAVDPAQLAIGGPPKDSGRYNSIKMALGPDLSGLPCMDDRILMQESRKNYRAHEPAIEAQRE